MRTDPIGGAVVFILIFAVAFCVFYFLRADAQTEGVDITPSGNILAVPDGFERITTNGSTSVVRAYVAPLPLREMLASVERNELEMVALEMNERADNAGRLASKYAALYDSCKNR